MGRMRADPRCCRRADGMGKRGYPSKKLAKRALRRITGSEVAVGLLHIYRCDHCRLWHMGRRREGERA